MSAKRKWEIGASLAFAAVLAVAASFAVRQWLINEALAKAVWDSNPDRVRSLLRQGADPNHSDWQYQQPLVTYATRSSGATLKVLLQAGANPNSVTRDGEVPLVYAARSNYLDCVQILLRFGADVNAADPEGRTSLMAAAEAGDSTEMVRTLLRSGARVTPKNRRGETAIDLGRKRLSESGQGVGEKWRAEVTQRQRIRRSAILRLLLEAEARETAVRAS